jgi:hypothetical protein
LIFGGILSMSGICHQGCQNGRCTAPSECTCNAGWSETDCSIRLLARPSICRFLIDAAICLRACINGNCRQPDVCDCDDGWVGAQCNIGMYYLSIAFLFEFDPFSNMSSWLRERRMRLRSRHMHLQSWLVWSSLQHLYAIVVCIIF